MTSTPSKEIIRLEYRVAVLEGIVNWMLTNGVFVKSIESSEMEQIHGEAVDLLKRRYPQAQIDFRFEGRWQR
jgi:hypothetical protein